MDGQEHIGPAGGNAHGKHDDQHDDDGDHVHADPHEAPSSMLKWVSTVLGVIVAIVLATMINQSVHDYKIKDLPDYVWRRVVGARLASSDDAAKAWRKQLQTNVDDLPLAPQGDKYISGLIELSADDQDEIACPALLRLGYAYFSVGSTGELVKASAALERAEKKCSKYSKYKGLMEEIHHLHGRAHNQMARIKELPETIRVAYEDLAWKSFGLSLKQQESDQREFAVVTLLQMCTLSRGRPDNDVTVLQRHVKDTLATIDSHTVRVKLWTDLMTQPIRLEKAMNDRTKQQMYPNPGAGEPSNNLKSLLEAADTDK